MTDDEQLADDQTLEVDVEALLQENAKLKDLAARAQADLQNAKSRLDKEAGDSRKYASEGLLRTLLPTIDNFQRAFAHLPEDLQEHEWVKGVQAVEQAFMNDVQAAGLQRMNSLGEPSDPQLHEILQMGPGEEGVVTEVFEEGYVLHDKVLRPAKVKVGDGSEMKEKSE